MAAHARRLCATLAAISLALLAGCKTPETIKPVVPVAQVPPPPEAPHQLSADSQSFLRLPNMTGDKTPLRVGVILPFSNGSAGTKALANAMLKAAQLALYDSGNRDMVLMTADDSTGTGA